MARPVFSTDDVYARLTTAAEIMDDVAEMCDYMGGKCPDAYDGCDVARHEEAAKKAARLVREARDGVREYPA